ncbi:hypothetical protein [uncultured Pseudodesulfovibrio sp.]|uniref:hypothetical protein n=1 Tax=uncultured Pseudodesulfovibrio sp. TaxID=2035858 RepID=UPI0029C62C14|nr:hypothetical protein [uncultured Pseudodesulfovibrio sp.]
MSINYRSEIEDDYLHIVVEGSLCSLDEVLHYVRNMYGGLAQAGLSKLLVDETKCHLHIGIDGFARVVREIQETAGVEFKHKKAIVSSDMNNPLFLHIFDSVDRVRIFADKEEARKWLAETWAVPFLRKREAHDAENEKGRGACASAHSIRTATPVARV